jgi:hypothetical protein
MCSLIEPRPTTITYLGGVRGIRRKYSCSGVRMCEFIHPELVNIQYHTPTNELWERLRLLWSSVEWDPRDLGRKKAEE